MTCSPSAYQRISRQNSLSWCQCCGWEPFCWLGSGESSAWEQVLPGWISRYLPGSSWQSGYPKCLAEIPPGYKSLLLKCLITSFQQGAVQSFPDSCDAVSHTHMKFTPWHFSATLFTRWYKHRNISSRLTLWCFSVCIECFREARRRERKGRICPMWLGMLTLICTIFMSQLPCIHQVTWSFVFHFHNSSVATAAMLK